MDHWATISADFPTNGRKVKILYHKGLFFAASRCLPLERIFYPDSGGSHNFDTSGVKVFSREGWLWPLWNSEYVKAPSNPVGGTSGPLDHKLNQKFVPTGHKVKIFSVGCLVLTHPDAYHMKRKILFKSAQVFGSPDAYHLRGSSHLYLENWIAASDMGSISGAAPWTDI